MTYYMYIMFSSGEGPWRPLATIAMVMVPVTAVVIVMAMAIATVVVILVHRPDSPGSFCSGKVPGGAL